MTLLSLPTVLLLSLLFTNLSHPLALGVILLLQTIMISITAGTSLHSFWFSYILFMIFLGGMLVLFIYVASLASNEYFQFSLSTFSTFAGIALLLTLLCLFMDPITIPNMSSLPSTSMITHLSTPFLISWIYSSTSMIFTLFIILYLLLALIVVVNITNLFHGPLRLSN
uniref:NADH-ubiquinone oxidoreductase chain 6 n=1 Tax=Leptodius sanguineus TaxID=903667 RepID=A0A140GMC9_9EUCA|nr:NADH dehydrogenase subunit 6 [Leptodius sanguineus]AMN14565.1 NADH dehydrogenase subunit 6 [Leptodius sanguineus]